MNSVSKIFTKKILSMCVHVCVYMCVHVCVCVCTCMWENRREISLRMFVDYSMKFKKNFCGGLGTREVCVDNKLMGTLVLRPEERA